MPLIVVSLMINTVAFGLLALALLGHGITMLNTYGPDTAARRILASLYATIAITSFAALLSAAVLADTSYMVQIAVILLPVQILFILISRLSLDTANVVATAKLVIAALHMLSLLVYWL